MEYHYLACDGPNCEQRRDLRTYGDSGDATDDQGNDSSQAEQSAQNVSTPSEQQAVDEQTGGDGQDSTAYALSWYTLDTGAQVFHFCTYDCLTAFVNDPNAADNTLKRYADFLGYDYP